jgi:hypothetical protein
MAANPEIRWQVLNKVVPKNRLDSGELTPVIQAPAMFDPIVQEYNPARPVRKLFEFFSLDHRLLQAARTTKVAGVDPTNYQSVLQEIQNNPDGRLSKSFIRAFTYTHTNQNTENILGAQIQDALFRIGPNADTKTPPRSFFRPIDTVPETSPAIISALQAQYNRTQKVFENFSIDEAELYRGTNSGFKFGLPMSPWSEDEHVAQIFSIDSSNPASKLYAEVTTARIPKKYIWITSADVNFNEYESGNEYEVLVLEHALMANATRRRKTYSSMDNPISQFEITIN